MDMQTINALHRAGVKDHLDIMNQPSKKSGKHNESKNNKLHNNYQLYNTGAVLLHVRE